ncbi:MAG: hypothetical protein HKP37_05060 [Boseongicola sp.]|nr:hypothetical protein [Boseongicola sp.]
MADSTTPDGEAPFLSLQTVRPFPLVVMSALTLIFALARPPGAAMIGFLGAGAGLAAAAVLLWALAIRNVMARILLERGLEADARVEAAPVIVGDLIGRIRFANAAALSELTADNRIPFNVADILSGILADPSCVTSRLLRLADQTGHALEDITTSEGTLRLRVQKRGPMVFVWRAEIIGAAYSDVIQARSVPELGDGKDVETQGRAADVVGQPSLTSDVVDDLPVPS